MPFQTKHRRPQYGRPTMKRGGRGAPKKQDIHPSRFVKKAVVGVEAEVYVPTHAFADFVVEDILAKNIAGRGFEMPSPIQDQSIPVGLKGHDIIGIANTGTGKTVAFAVPVLNRLVQNSASRVLIMAPTRELAQQIEDEIKWLAKGTGLTGAVLIGGASMGPQLRDLRAKPRIVVGTPGRIKDHMERGSLDISDVDTVVLDEVDRMLDMGFVHDMRDILREVKSDRQSFFFSATMTGRVSELINEFSHEPITISVKTGDTSDNVEQDIIPYENKADKIDQLHRLLSSGIGKAIVFDGTQRSVERLCKELQMAGFAADAIHGGRSQGQRQKALDRFKKGDVTILVATDVAARGIDIPDVTHVINYETPQSYDDYVHRIGRAGRAGKTGTALTFVQA